MQPIQKSKSNYTWTLQQDATITMLYEQKRIEDWERISRILSQQYNFPKKPPQHIKERYMSSLNTTTSKIQWTQQEQQQFMRLHNQIGNKWATIAQHLQGKTDNCVKNHFYSKLRKLLRKLNKIIQLSLKKQFRPIDISIMYKIVEAAQERFKQKPNCQISVSEECHCVQNKMLQFAMFKDSNNEERDEEARLSQINFDDYAQLIREIYRVSKLYKRKSKKVRNSLIQAPVNQNKRKNKKEGGKIEHKQNQSQIELKENEFGAEVKENKFEAQIKENESKNKGQLYDFKQRLPTTILIRKQQDRQVCSYVGNRQQQNHKAPNLGTRIQVGQGEGIQALLRTAGILQDQINPSRVEMKNRKSSIFSQYSGMNIPSPIINGSGNNLIQNSSSVEYSPLNEFSSHQVQNFLGFPMVNNSPASFANFTLSEKSSFKSYSERDPSEIDNPFFDDYSSNSARLMFPMNFNLPSTPQYQEYNPHCFETFSYENIYFEPHRKQDSEGESYIRDPKGN